MESYPKIKEVEPLSGRKLLVTFSNNAKKIYDCTSLLKEEAFKPLSNNVLFQTVKADEYGYGVIWSDEIDLSESELWINGIPAEQSSGVDGK